MAWLIQTAPDGDKVRATGPLSACQKEGNKLAHAGESGLILVCERKGVTFRWPANLAENIKRRAESRAAQEKTLKERNAETIARAKEEEARVAKARADKAAAEAAAKAEEAKEAKPAKKRRGRPPGSKNKPKPPPAE